MEQLLNNLKKIDELLEQIYTITQNQTTILLSPDQMIGSDEEYSLMNQMVDYKQSLIEALAQYEELFQRTYDDTKNKLTSQKQVEVIQKQIKCILEKKENITTCEKNNLVIMQAHYKEIIKTTQIKPNAKDVTMAYKKNQTKP